MSEKTGKERLWESSTTEEYSPALPEYWGSGRSINDGVDSLAEGSNDFSPIRNWANELHAKDSSKKVRAVKMLQAERGERLTDTRRWTRKADGRTE